MPSDAEFLKAYLADRDVPCPGCAYNLKGCVSDRCPECGLVATLAIGSPSASKLDVWLLRGIILAYALGLLLAVGFYAYQLWERFVAVNGSPIAGSWRTHLYNAVWAIELGIVAILLVRAFNRRKSSGGEFHRKTVRWGMIALASHLVFRTAMMVVQLLSLI